MALVDETLPASYRGVNFLVSVASISGGIKHAKHLFPNSKKQNIESLGTLPDSFVFDIYITANPDGEFYLQKRDNFLRVIREGIPGPLIHPFYGLLEDIVATTFSGTETFLDLGNGKFKVNFEFNTSTGQPLPEEFTLPNVRNEVQIVLTAISTDISDNFEVSTKYPSNFTTAIDKLEAIVEEFNDNTSFLSVAADAINDFSSELGDFENDITSLITNPTQLATSVTSLFNTVNGLYDTVEATFAVMIKFFEFGENDPDTASDTVGRIEKNRNDNLLNGIIQSQSLVLSYDNAAQISFQTIPQIESVEETLEIQYQQVQSNEDLDTDTLGAITDLRSLVQSFFNDAKLNASQVLTVQSNIIPASVLAYKYYGETTLTETLIDLNQDLNTSFLQGDLEIITQ